MYLRERVSRALFSASQRATSQSLSKEGKSSTSTSSQTISHHSTHSFCIVLQPDVVVLLLLIPELLYDLQQQHLLSLLCTETKAAAHQTHPAVPHVHHGKPGSLKHFSKTWTSSSARRELFTAFPYSEVLLVVSKEVFKFKLLFN